MIIRFNYLSYTVDNINQADFVQFKGNNLEVLKAIWLVIILGRYFMPTNIVTGFDDETIKIT